MLFWTTFTVLSSRYHNLCSVAVAVYFDILSFFFIYIICNPNWPFYYITTLKKRCPAHIRNASREGQPCIISCPLTESIHIGKLGNITFWPCTLSWVERSWNTIYCKTHSGYRASTVNDIPFITTQMRTQNDIGKQWTHQKGRESH